MVDGVRHFTGSVCRDTRALAERHKPADWCITECAKLKKGGRARTRGGPDPESILVDICVFVVVNTPTSNAE